MKDNIALADALGMPAFLVADMRAHGQGAGSFLEGQKGNASGISTGTIGKLYGEAMAAGVLAGNGVESWIWSH